jgi:hypothetical protein
MTTPDCDIDFYAWTQAQAEALRVKEWKTPDIGHLAAEVESSGIDAEHAITRQLQRLLPYLLKWRYYSAHQTPR